MDRDEPIRVEATADHIIDWLKSQSAEYRHYLTISIGSIILVMAVGEHDWSWALSAASGGFMLSAIISLMALTIFNKNYGQVLGLTLSSNPSTMSDLRSSQAIFRLTTYTVMVLSVGGVVIHGILLLMPPESVGFRP